MHRSLRLTTLLVLLSASTSARAEGWAKFMPSFPAFPCQDGWAGCIVEGQARSAELVEGPDGVPLPADLRLDWFGLEPTPVFSPFPTLSVYSRPEEAPVADAAPAPARPRPDLIVIRDAPRPVAPQPVADVVAPSPAPAAPSPQPSPVSTVSVSPSPAPPTPTPPSPTPGPTPKPKDVLPPPQPALVQAAAAGCDDLLALEPFAALGRLDPGQRTCLEGRLSAAKIQTDKERISLVLMADAFGRGDQAAWGKLARRHLEEISQADPDLAYKYAMSLHKKGLRHDEGAIRWADVALENAHVWTADTHVSRKFALLKLRAQAANALWLEAEAELAALPNDDARKKADDMRNRAKTLAREWLDYSRTAGKDSAPALQLCVSAAGTTEACGG